MHIFGELLTTFKYKPVLNDNSFRIYKENKVLYNINKYNFHK